MFRMRRVAKRSWQRIPFHREIFRGEKEQKRSCNAFQSIEDNVMDDPNITMGEYIRLEEEKARRHVSFDDSDDEDYTVIFDKNSFYYKIIYVNDLKTDSENDNEKVNIPSLPPPEPIVSYFDDLDFFKDFEDEFPAIVYIDALTSKSDFLIEPTIIIQHIDEFNLKDETSLSECDEEEQNVLKFNDIFPFNVIYPNDSKSDKDNNDDKVNIEHSSRDLSVKPLPITVDMAYSLNENNVYDTGLTEKKRDVGEVSSIGNFKCWSLENFKALFILNIANKIIMGIYEQI
ncbi:hypothetical protein Tco_0089172 [Tanacetum coccineum]